MNTYKTMQTENNIYCQLPKALAEIKQPFPETPKKKKSFFSKLMKHRQKAGQLIETSVVKCAEC